MWNHAPRMSAAGAKPQHFEAGEMRELLSYLWAKQFFESAGNAPRGKRVFTTKQCATCHENGSSAPKLSRAGGSFSAADMVAGLWRHGPAMLERMRSQNIRWPRFDASEMPDLIAYLNSQGNSK
jgi:mono/diheme cytochrome c family protein